jgi:hypothetical protein
LRAFRTIGRGTGLLTRTPGGKAHAMPCHHNLETYLLAYIEGAGLAGDPKGPALGA